MCVDPELVLIELPLVTGSGPFIRDPGGEVSDEGYLGIRGDRVAAAGPD